MGEAEVVGVVGRWLTCGRHGHRLFRPVAGTGDLRWRHDATGGISGAPTVMAGLVYYSTFGKFTNSHQRHVEDGPYRTYALNARTGKPVWQAAVAQVISATRTPGGRTLAVNQQGQQVVELDRAGKVVWQHRADGSPWVARR